MGKDKKPKYVTNFKTSENVAFSKKNAENKSVDNN